MSRDDIIWVLEVNNCGLQDYIVMNKRVLTESASPTIPLGVSWSGMPFGILEMGNWIGFCMPCPSTSLPPIPLYQFSFPGLPTVQFWSLAVCKNGGGRPGPFYDMNDVSVYLSRQRGGGVPDRKDAFRRHVLCFEPRAIPKKFRIETVFVAAYPIQANYL